MLDTMVDTSPAFPLPTSKSLYEEEPVLKVKQSPKL